MNIHHGIKRVLFFGVILSFILVSVSFDVADYENQINLSEQIRLAYAEGRHEEVLGLADEYTEEYGYNHNVALYRALSESALKSPEEPIEADIEPVEPDEVELPPPIVEEDPEEIEVEEPIIDPFDEFEEDDEVDLHFYAPGGLPADIEPSPWWRDIIDNQLFWLILAGILVLFIIILLKTFVFKTKTMDIPPEEESPVDKESLIEEIPEDFVSEPEKDKEEKGEERQEEEEEEEQQEREEEKQADDESPEPVKTDEPTGLEGLDEEKKQKIAEQEEHDVEMPVEEIKEESAKTTEEKDIETNEWVKETGKPSGKSAEPKEDITSEKGGEDKSNEEIQPTELTEDELDDKLQIHPESDSFEESQEKEKQESDESLLSDEVLDIPEVDIPDDLLEESSTEEDTSTYDLDISIEPDELMKDMEETEKAGQEDKEIDVTQKSADEEAEKDVPAEEPEEKKSETPEELSEDSKKESGKQKEKDQPADENPASSDLSEKNAKMLQYSLRNLNKALEAQDFRKVTRYARMVLSVDPQNKEAQNALKKAQE